MLDNASAEWLAWEGSGDYEDAEHGGTIDGVMAPRQPGSALKPFTYALAFERGFTPASVLPDVPAHFPTAQQGILYMPRNYDGVFRGPLCARGRAGGSENVPAVGLLSQVGVPDLLRLLRRSGLATLDKTADHYGYALTMGDAEVRLDVVAAYAALARGGVFRSRAWCDPRRTGGRLRRRALLPSRARDAPSGSPTCCPTRRRAPTSSGAAEASIFRSGSRSKRAPRRPTTTTGPSASRGTSPWVCGWATSTARRCAPRAAYGAAPIFHDVILAAADRAGDGGRGHGEDRAIVDAPAGLANREVCATSGMAATPWCPARRRERLPAGDEAASCSWHHQSDQGLLTIWPPAYQAWARQSGLLAGSTTVPASVAVRAVRDGGAAVSGLTIASPPSGATYLIDPTLRREFQTLPLRVAGARPGPVTWSIDGVPLGRVSSDAALPWPLSPGTHAIEARDGGGRTAEARIVVR